MTRVSVVMPCLDEERFVEAAVRSLLAGTFPADEMELIVVDGRSEDRTVEIVAALAKEDRRVRLVDNPDRITPVALNRGIAAARGAIVVRVDAHTTYPPDYVEVLVRTLEETGADLVGGTAESVPSEESDIAQAIVLSLGGRFGTGSPVRYRRTSGPADTVEFGCWRRELFDRVGPFDERLVRNQDYEHARRIGHLGGRVHLTVETSIRYHPRATLRALWRTAAQTGMWNAFMHRLHPYTFAWRHLLPGVFFVGVLFIAALITTGLATGRAGLVWIGALLILPYLVANLISSTLQAHNASCLSLAPLAAFATASHHVAYGYGICKGWLLVITGGWRALLGRRVATTGDSAQEVQTG